MKRRQIFLVVIIVAVLVHLAISVGSSIYSSRVGSPETVGYGRSQNYRELSGRGGYRVFENTVADKVGVTDPYGVYADNAPEAEAELSRAASAAISGDESAGAV